MKGVLLKLRHSEEWGQISRVEGKDLGRCIKHAIFD